MKKLLIWLSVLAVVVIGGKRLADHMSHTAHERAATTRVQALLDALKPGGDFQAAFNMWYAGSPEGIGSVTQDQYNMYTAEMRAWLAQRGFGQSIEAYEIHGATMVRPPQGIEPSLVEVSCTIDGKAVVIRAVDGERLVWAE